MEVSEGGKAGGIGRGTSYDDRLTPELTIDTNEANTLRGGR
jgi:hypothetical protein